MSTPSLEQVGGKAVAQRVRSDPLGDLRGLCRLDDDAMELPGADRLHGVLSRKQPTVTMSRLFEGTALVTAVIRWVPG